MTPHLHSQYVPGCYRCDLGRDEMWHAFCEVAEEGPLTAERREELRGFLDTLDGWDAADRKGQQ